MKTRKFLPALLLSYGLAACSAGNLHTVENNKVYRSAQLPATTTILDNGMGETGTLQELTLEDVIKNKDIKTVLNLRGKKEGKAWYKEEVALTKKKGVLHYSVQFSQYELPRKEALLKVFKVFDTAPYPIIIHCQAGIDRAGLISALYKMHYQGKSVDDATKQLNFIPYGHLKIGKLKSMDDFFDLYKRFGNGKGIRKWIEQDYSRKAFQKYIK